MTATRRGAGGTQEVLETGSFLCKAACTVVSWATDIICWRGLGTGGVAPGPVLSSPAGASVTALCTGQVSDKGPGRTGHTSPRPWHPSIRLSRASPPVTGYERGEGGVTGLESFWGKAVTALPDSRSLEMDSAASRMHFLI